MEMTHKNTLGISLHRRDRGARWIVALHGLQSDQTLFKDLFTDPRFAPYSLLTLDLIGFGESEKPALFPYDLLQQAQRVLEVLDAEGIERITVVGHSLGGMVGTLLLRLAPARVERLVSLEGNLTKLDCGESLRVNEIDFPTFKASYPNRNLATPDYVFYKTSKSIVAWSESNELATLFLNTPQPKLLVLGGKSAFHSRPEGPHLTVKTIPGASHFMLREKPAETLAEIAEFLASPTVYEKPAQR